MGNKISNNNFINNVTDYLSVRKRKWSDEDDNEINKVIDIALRCPKKKKLVSTAKYIYQALFEEGKNSDITVSALGEDFLLHKVYLCQSPYFASMFGGSWLEATKKCIVIDIVDPLITIESLKVVFGSLYNCEITLNPMEIVSILATATMFQLDGLIEKCTEVMLETINPKTSLEYYNAACQYGDKKLQAVCFKWFLVNLMTYYFSRPMTNLKHIPIPLMTKLVAHPDLFVMQTEYSIYSMLKHWMYMLVHEDTESEALSSKDLNNFYSSRKGDVPFLFSTTGAKFRPVFRGLRLDNLVLHQMDIELVLNDNIIPHQWLSPIILQNWKHVLRVNQNDDKGPCDIPSEAFLSTSLRCGRILLVNERHMWRWTGFHFGVDLLMISEGNTLTIKRNHRSEFEQLLSFQAQRYVAIRVTIVKLNEQRQIVYSKESEIMKLNLSKGEEIQIMTFDKDLQYPIIISANILYTSQGEHEVKHGKELVQTVT